MDTSSDRTVRYLGAAFLGVFATSLSAGLMADPSLKGSIPRVLDKVADNITVVRASNLLQLVTAIGIIVLAALLYAVLRDANRPLALIGFGWWIAEGVFLAATALGTYGIMVASDAARTGGTPVATAELAGRFFLGLRENAFTIHMLFFCLGGFIWCYLLMESGIVPRWMGIWGMVGVVLLLVNMLLVAWEPGFDVGALGILAMVVYVPFEPVLGGWLLVRGAPAERVAASQLRGSLT